MAAKRRKNRKTCLRIEDRAYPPPRLTGLLTHRPLTHRRTGFRRTAPAVQGAFQQFRPDAIIHLAAESHVDRSIDEPAAFIQTNIAGTFTLLQAARAYWENLSAERRRQFRFLHVSTDEVFGSLAPDHPGFTETTAYAPPSPYSASKAAADHLVRSWHHTYGLPVLVTHCSNNYGPYQFPEKLIPIGRTGPGGKTCWTDPTASNVWAGERAQKSRKQKWGKQKWEGKRPREPHSAIRT